MAKKPTEIRLPMGANAPQDLAPAGALMSELGITASDQVNRKIAEIHGLLWRYDGESEKSVNIRLTRAIELYESLVPADGAEGMLAMQMVGTHFAALECLRRAALPNQTMEGRDLNLKHAQKLMALYSQQLAALNKHRGKGQQKVTVEHVHVAAGGQAIVGTVEARTASRRPAAEPAALEHQPAMPVDLGLEKAPVRRKPKAE